MDLENHIIHPGLDSVSGDSPTMASPLGLAAEGFQGAEAVAKSLVAVEGSVVGSGKSHGFAWRLRRNPSALPA
jgi:hypothetical protein